MPDMNPPGPANRIAVIDVGSNSLRLVVFESLGTTLVPLLNEKVTGALGRNIATTGKLNPEGVTLALPNLQRFVALARALKVDHLAIIATSAVRDASDGGKFARDAERLCGIPVQIIPGAEEARLSASGVLAGMRRLDGIVGDLGGGSVELIPVNSAAREQIGTGVSLPIGALRLAELGDNRRAVLAAIERAIDGVGLLRRCAGKSLYLVGGAWRALARLHMEHDNYPLHIIHEYTIPRRAAEAFLGIISGQSRRSLDRVTGISRKRLELVPLAALILARLIAAAKPEHVVFSAFGLREGYAYGLLPNDQGHDALIAACEGIAATQSRWRDGERLQRWIAPAFPGLKEDSRRLHGAVCWLSDFAWSEHPDYRAEHAFRRSLSMPVAQLSHPERVFIARALHARYGGNIDDPVTMPTRPLIDDAAANEARALGLALRLAYTLCGGALDLLDQVRLTRRHNTVTLDMPDGHLFGGEAVQRRLEALNRVLGLPSPSARRTPALA
ncbi:MAG: Ppx/GppA family phosphatase [Alphaproteobacteria bacterium]|nr:Ppx/GppA family phosphatase [Alphaproteobacteria bacterium]